jgi:hypothetical protein
MLSLLSAARFIHTVTEFRSGAAEVGTHWEVAADKLVQTQNRASAAGAAAARGRESCGIYLVKSVLNLGVNKEDRHSCRARATGLQKLRWRLGLA